MASTIAIARALIAVMGFLNTIVSLIYARASEQDRAALNAAFKQAKLAKTVEEAANAASQINDSF